MKRKLKWLAIVLAVSLLGFGTALLLWPRDRITVESWQKIQIGMTEKEVAEILGGAGMNYWDAWDGHAALEKELGRPPFLYEGPTPEEPTNKWPFVVGDRVKVWTGRRGLILIESDRDKNVCWKQFHGVRWINGGILDRLRDWLGW